MSATPGTGVAAPRLIFVYNAEAGLIAGAFDLVHKIVSPSTYPCSLCAVTHGTTGMRRDWRDWLRTLPMAAVFHHRTDFHAAWPAAANWPLPLVAFEHDGQLEPLLDAATLNGLPDLGALIAALETRIAAKA